MNVYLSNIQLMPFKQLNIILKKKSRMEINLHDIVDDYITSNPEIFDKLFDFLYNYFNSGITGNMDNKITSSISDEDIKGFENQIKIMDKGFEEVIKAIKNLNYKEKKELYIEFYEDLIKSSMKQSNALSSELKNKENLTSTDILFYTYFNSCINLYKVLAANIEKSNKKEINKNIMISNFISMIYSIIIIQYFKNNLSEETLFKRLGELNMLVTPYENKISNRVDDALNKIMGIPPPYND